MKTVNDPPFISIVGASGAGKTTLIEKLVPELVQRGLRVGTVKHDVHGFEMDRPGKDSWRHKQAGAAVTLISSPFQIGMVKDVDHDHQLDELSPYFQGTDLILAEGYKKGQKEKLEVFRPEVNPEPLCKDDDTLIALISDTPFNVDVPRLQLNDITKIADFLINHFRLKE